MSCAVGSFELALERIALFLRPILRGRATEGEVGEAALFLLSLDCDCELPIIVCVRAGLHLLLLPGPAVSSLHSAAPSICCGGLVG
jgi:hypothetical protein